MAQGDGSGDISFLPEEFAAMAHQMLQAAAEAKPGDLLTLSVGRSHGVVTVNVRPPWLRRPLEKLEFNLLRPLGTSVL